MKIKKALLICTLCLFVCFTMLIGTTFAWFTDSVSSGKNSIVSGTLDIELTYDDNGTDTVVDETTILFDDIENMIIFCDGKQIQIRNWRCMP